MLGDWDHETFGRPLAGLECGAAEVSLKEEQPRAGEGTSLVITAPRRARGQCYLWTMNRRSPADWSRPWPSVLEVAGRIVVVSGVAGPYAPAREGRQWFRGCRIYEFDERGLGLNPLFDAVRELPHDAQKVRPHHRVLRAKLGFLLEQVSGTPVRRRDAKLILDGRYSRERFGGRHLTGRHRFEYPCPFGAGVLGIHEEQSTGIRRRASTTADFAIGQEGHRLLGCYQSSASLSPKEGPRQAEASGTSKNKSSRS